MTSLQLAFLDDTHIVFGDSSGVRGAIDVYQKKTESLAQDLDMSAFMSQVDKSGIAWSAVSYPPEQVKMIADANPLLKAIEGFKGMIMAIDDKDSALVVDIRTLGGNAEQNAVFATNLNGLKAVGALYAAGQPALAELLNGIAITSGEDYTRLNLTVSHEALWKSSIGWPSPREPTRRQRSRLSYSVWPGGRLPSRRQRSGKLSLSKPMTSAAKDRPTAPLKCTNRRLNSPKGPRAGPSRRSRRAERDRESLLSPK
ncbi:MAG: hypothetical protein M0C28_42005 [Candidatus Moduliflexus flocculans]|nr:hypothetical protein [Candidatus Moduliflexus flocculans]